MIRMIEKRDGRNEPFNRTKIEEVVFRAVLESTSYAAGNARAVALLVAGHVEKALEAIRVERGLPEDNRDAMFPVEMIQDRVEEALMQAHLYDTARHYILHRNKRRARREERPIDPAHAARVAADQALLPEPIQLYQHQSKYSRWLESEGRREIWSETVDRAMGAFRDMGGSLIPEAVYAELGGALRRQEALPSMRLLQMAGPALDRCSVCAYNCAYCPIDSLFAFSELLYIMMQGTGIGFSVERQYIDRLPRVKRQKARGEVPVHVVPDDTVGWCMALNVGLTAWWAGKDVTFDYTQIRPAGTRLLTKGGRASGPEPLRELLDFARTMVLSRQDGRLSSAEAHRLACMCGRIVQVGGVRRAAQISLSDLDDLEMRDLKGGAFWETMPELGQANNSAVYDEAPTAIEFMEEWLALAKSGSGERGIFNREGSLKQRPSRRKTAEWGVNPCGEILLRPREFCNLSIAVARPDDTEETLVAKVRQATIFGTLQSTLTDFEFLPEAWKKNAEEERLLGVDITGQMDCPLLQPRSPHRDLLLQRLRQVALETNREFAALLGINPSAAITCVKPSGNSAWLLFCGSGLHAWWSPYFIRRTEASRIDPLTQLLIDAGVPWHPKPGDDPQHPRTILFEWPIKAPEGAITRDQLTACDQFANWLQLKQHWCEHNPSTTIYVGPDEWFALGEKVYANWDWVGGLAFLPRSDYQYLLAPYQQIEREEYEERLARFPVIPWAKLSQYESEDTTTSSQELACVGDRCELSL